MLTDTQVRQASFLIGDLARMTGFTRQQLIGAVNTSDNLALAVNAWVLGGASIVTCLEAVYDWASEEGGE